MTKMDIKQIGKNFSYSIQCLPNTEECDYVSCVEASLLHHFDIHTSNCGDWCARKNQSDEVRKQKDRYYRCTTKKMQSCMMSWGAYALGSLSLRDWKNLIMGWTQIWMNHSTIPSLTLLQRIESFAQPGLWKIE